MIPFTIDEIELLLSALDAWEATARHDIATKVTQEVTSTALQMAPEGATPAELSTLVTKLTQENQIRYTMDMVKKLMRERNEPSALLKARLILMKQEIERNLMDRIADDLDLFKRKEGDESDVQ